MFPLWPGSNQEYYYVDFMAGLIQGPSSQQMKRKGGRILAFHFSNWKYFPLAGNQYSAVISSNQDSFPDLILHAA